MILKSHLEKQAIQIMKNDKKVILLIVEGDSEESFLIDALRNTFEQHRIHFSVYGGDVLYDLSKGKKPIKSIIGDTVKEFVVNEKLLEQLGVHNPADAINKKIDFWNWQKVGLIVGVIKDFHASSLRNPIEPVMMSTWSDVYQIANLKIQYGKVKESLAAVENL